MPLCFISIGSNINREHNISSALGALDATFGTLTHSSLYESASVGFTGTAFYNLVSAFHSEHDAIHINKKLKEIETEHGRVAHKEKFSARTLDLDLLLYDQAIIHTEAIKIPHNDILNYAFVLEPLAEIAPKQQHPIKQMSYAQLWSDFDKSKVRQQKINAASIANIRNQNLIIPSSIAEEFAAQPR